MIKLFRNIRQNLLNEGKTSKYLTYAIGEIVLVVVGILIALAINNSNENRTKHQFEITIIENIQEDILADKVDVKMNRQYLNLEYVNEQRLLNFLLSDGLPPSDSISYVDALGIDLATAFHEASFNNLQNSDIGILSNNDLYKKITRYYDFYVASLKEIENNHGNANFYDEKLIFFKKHFKVINSRTRIYFSDEQAWSQDFHRYDFSIKSIDALKADEEFKIVLAESLFINRIKLGFYQQLITKMEDLKSAIVDELKVLND